MAAATPPGVTEQSKHSLSDSGAVPFDISQPPDIEGFTPSPIVKYTFTDKFIRKTKENPFVPIGCLGTAGILALGLRAFVQGKARESMMFMRARIAAQGFTIVAFVAGVYITAYKAKQ